jgi:hypothetical protein
MLLKDVKLGQTVRVDAATDLWMRGVRWAHVVKVGRKWVTIYHPSSGTKHRVPAQILTLLYE